MGPAAELMHASTQLDDDGQACCSETEPGGSIQTDSGIGLDDGTGSQSTLGGHIYLFGRRYRHWAIAQDNCERYFCPDDEREVEQQEAQHNALTLLMEGKLHLAPLPTTSPIQVLDVCTGSGTWAIDVGLECPEWNVMGVDWSPIQPNYLPANVSFQFDDMRRLPWYRSGCDYIHMRATIHTGCWKDFKAEAVEQAFESLQPGGWFESHELGRLVDCDDGTLPAQSPLASWARILDRAGALKGQPRHVADKMVQWYREVGFVDVQQRRLKMPIGGWPLDGQMKEIGYYWQVSLELGLESLSLRLLHEAFGWDLPKMMELLACVKQDIRNRSIHAYTQVYVVYGRKPTPGELLSVDKRTYNTPEAGGEEPALSPPCPLSAERAPSWSPTPEPPRPSSTDPYGSDARDDADSSGGGGGGSSASASLADDASANSSLFRQQRQDLVNYLVGQLCRYLDSRVAEAQLVRAVRSLHTDEGSQQRGGEQSQSATLEERALRVEQSGEAGGSAGGRSYGRGLPPPGHEGEEGSDGGGDDKRRKRPRLASASSEETKRFACPYYKRNPRKYCKWTSCPGPGWDEIHRVKAHLYKRHALPLQCPRCWEPFRGEGFYRQHLQQDPPCVVEAVQRNMLDGFTKEQEEMLRSRRRVRPGTGPADKWREIYMILFPDDNVDNIPSPYHEPTDNDANNNAKEDCAVFLRREMPAAARRELDLMFQDGFRDMEVALRPRIEQLMVDLQSRLLRTRMFQENEAGGESVEPGEPQGTEGEREGEGYETTAGRSAEQGAPPPLKPPELSSTELGTVVQQQEGLWDWDRDPSVSGSADTLLPPENFFDISFEKLLDPTFAYSVETQEWRADLT